MNDVSVYLVDRGGARGPWSKERISRMFLIMNGTFFALQTFETPVLGVETTRQGFMLIISIGDTLPLLST